jgi:deoxycytidylate deaminase
VDSLLKLARLQAEKVEMVKRSHKTIFRLGAVLFDGNRVLNVGHNYANKTHPQSNNPYKTIHAEFDAILGVPRWQLEGSSLLVVRLNMAGQFVLAKPCEHCQALIEAAKIQKVYWTDNAGEVVSQILY